MAEGSAIRGLHHVTAISGPAQENLDFYAGVLGMRLVKKSVNQDDPGTYHLFYADAVGSPGTDLTFFPWERMAPARRGHGVAAEVSLAVLPESLDWWRSRLEGLGVEVLAESERFGERVVNLVDPHGLPLALVAGESAGRRPFAPWPEGPVPPEHQIRGLDGARATVLDVERTTQLLREAMGFRRIGDEHGWQRWSSADGTSGTRFDLRSDPNAPRGMWGTGGIHHLAWRVDDDAHQARMRSRVEAAETSPTPVIDRFWFRSVYFREPGGVLFELATDGPGFAVDEAPEHLGEALVLPPWLEPHRDEIAAVLPALGPPAAIRA